MDDTHLHVCWLCGTLTFKCITHRPTQDNSVIQERLTADGKSAIRGIVVPHVHGENKVC